MSDSQRQSLRALMAAILACACCPPDIRLRAELLDERLRPDPFESLFGARR